MKKRKFKIILLLSALIILGCSKDDGASKPISNDDSPVVVDDTKVTIDFTKTYGGTLNESARAVVSTLDGGYAIFGYTQSMDIDITDKQDESFDYWVLKYAADGTLQWNKTYGGADNDRGHDIIQTRDGGYALLGFSSSIDGDVTGNAGAEDFWVVKLDASGNLIWQKSYGFEGSDQAFSIIESKTGGYLLTGALDVTASGGAGNTDRVSSARHAGGDYWAVKLDNNGELEWSKYFGGFFTDSPESVVETEDGGYLMAGWSDSADVDISNNKGSYDFWLVKIDNLGILEWEKNYGGTEIDEAFGLIASGDGNYMLCGSTRSNNTDISLNKGGSDFWLIKVSSSGNLIWEKSYGGTEFDVARAISSAKDGGFVLSGSSRSQDGDVKLNQGQNDGWVIKVDSKGDLKWEVSAGGSDIDFFYDVVELNDGSVIAVGDTYSNDGSIQENKGFSDLLTVKIK